MTMTTITILYLIGSFILGSILTFGLFKFFITKSIKRNYISRETIQSSLNIQLAKRGLLKKAFTWDLGKTDEAGDPIKKIVNCECEFTVVEETADLYKIVIDEVDMDNWSYSDDAHMSSYKRAFAGWYGKTDKILQLFKERPEEVRARKLSEILN